MNITDKEFKVLQQVFSVIAQVEKKDNQAEHGLFWRIDNNKLSLFVNCNDLFFWACSDLEEITPQNIDVFVETANVLQVNHQLNYANLAILFCAKSRKLQPQGAVFSKLSPLMVTLLEQVGIEREEKSPNTAKPKDLERLPVEYIKSVKNQLDIYDFEDKQLFLRALEMFAFEDCDVLDFKIEQDNICMYFCGQEYFNNQNVSFDITHQQLDNIKQIQKLFKGKYTVFLAIDFYLHKKYGQEVPEYIISQMI